MEYSAVQGSLGTSQTLIGSSRKYIQINSPDYPFYYCWEFDSGTSLDSASIK